jgi:hypothetical protein
MMLERETYIVLSTAHLAPSTTVALAGLPILCDGTDHRYRIPLEPALEWRDGLPCDLAELLTTIAAATPEACGVMLDCDGPVVTGLATFDW